MLRRSFSKNGATSWCVCVTYEQEVHQPPPEQTEEAPAHQLQKLYSGDIRFVLQCPEVELSSEIPAREDRSFVCNSFCSIGRPSLPSLARRSAFVAKTGRYWPRSVMRFWPSAGGMTARILGDVLRDCASHIAVTDGL